jgi:hypothetical protein
LTPVSAAPRSSLRELMPNVIAEKMIALIEGRPPGSCLNPKVIEKLF